MFLVKQINVMNQPLVSSGPCSIFTQLSDAHFFVEQILSNPKWCPPKWRHSGSGFIQFDIDRILAPSSLSHYHTMSMLYVAACFFIFFLLYVVNDLFFEINSNVCHPPYTWTYVCNLTSKLWKIIILCSNSFFPQTRCILFNSFLLCSTPVCVCKEKVCKSFSKEIILWSQDSVCVCGPMFSIFCVCPPGI